MKNKYFSLTGILYMIFLFIVYEFLFRRTGFSINSAVYGLFGILIFFYAISGNLRFSAEPVACKTIFINGLIFGIFFLFYKAFSIFRVFIIFSIIQLLLERLIIKVRENIKSGTAGKYDSLINERSLIKLAIDSISITLGMILAYAFKFDKDWNKFFRKEYLFVYLGIFLIGYFYTRMNEKSWRYTNVMDVLNLIVLNCVSAILFFFIMYVRKVSYQRLIILAALIIATSGQLFCRYLFRLQRFYRNRNVKTLPVRQALIYGAGETGAILAQESLTNPKFPYRIAGFVDDNPAKKDSYMYNIKVLGNRTDLEQILKKENIEEVLLALPSINSADMQSIVNIIKSAGNIEIKTVPTITEILDTKELTSQLRQVRIEDLLGRDEVVINDNSIKNLIENKRILVTGGAGSIGSELIRQIARYRPEQVINLDINENDSYFLELEIQRKYPDLSIITEICSIREKEKLEILFSKYKPHIVFHAAAHKHVPLMEHNPDEAIKNNIFGTKNVAECAKEHGVDRMVLISSDKAVNPTNVMGVTKRACELIMQQMNKTSAHTKYMAVRFGNVLGSNGSVIPLFNNLLREGKNLTVTHKDVRRYFMTIPESALLVIEAAALGKGGEVFILDMGKPVRIYELAEAMIKLSNSNAGIDIVGMRPGEKLFEELLYDVNNAAKTENRKIFITNIEDSEIKIEDYFAKLLEISRKANAEEIRRVLKELVGSYREVKY
ncbi:MAG: polysaccharide biosynthesis protein [Fusobacteriaceae bacterium]|jgi:FlaA1/EpsC-like NDP-sugar epimerase|nr:polysaccharide biosynthesis protein [Fusobacteriaceae bacterium]